MKPSFRIVIYADQWRDIVRNGVKTAHWRRYSPAPRGYAHHEFPAQARAYVRLHSEGVVP
jgi:hypothetical protein